MNWQEPVALGIVAVTAAGFVVRWWRRRHQRFGKSGCSHCAPASARPKERIVFHARRGERPQVIIRPSAD